MGKLTQEERDALVKVRVERAFSTFEEAKGIAENEYWHSAANRLYYACYYITSSLLVKKGFDAATHSGVIRLFGLHFVSKGLVTEEWGRFYSKLFELRESGDYDDWVTFGKDDIVPLIPLVETYLQLIKHLIDG